MTHDPLCPLHEPDPLCRRKHDLDTQIMRCVTCTKPCHCALIDAVEDRMLEEWRDADAYHAAGLTT